MNLSKEEVSERIDNIAADVEEAKGWLEADEIAPGYRPTFELSQALRYSELAILYTTAGDIENARENFSNCARCYLRRIQSAKEMENEVDINTLLSEPGDLRLATRNAVLANDSDLLTEVLDQVQQMRDLEGLVNLADEMDYTDIRFKYWETKLLSAIIKDSEQADMFFEKAKSAVKEVEDCYQQSRFRMYQGLLRGDEDQFYVHLNDFLKFYEEWIDGTELTDRFCGTALMFLILAKERDIPVLMSRVTDQTKLYLPEILIY